MPEGPEVKIVVDYLNKKLEHKEITSFSYCSDPYKIKYKSIINSLNKWRDDLTIKKSNHINLLTFFVLVKAVF